MIRRNEMSKHQLPKIVAALLIVDVIAVYVYCLTIKGHYPPSHPWSGITLALLSAGLFQRFVLRERPMSVEPSSGMWTVVVLTAASAGLWTTAAFLSS
jgi:hypothetical protein